MTAVACGRWRWLVMALGAAVALLIGGRTGEAQQGPPTGGGGITPMCTGGSCPSGTVLVTPTEWNVTYGPNTTGLVATYAVENQRTVTTWIDLSCSRTGKVTSCGSVTPSGVSLAPGAYTSVTVTYATGTVGAGTVTLSATYDGGGGPELLRMAPSSGGPSPWAGGWDIGTAYTVASGTQNVTVAAPAPAGVALRNRPSRIDRAECLTTGAGEAAVQCGDLVVAHGMPTIRRLGRDRSLSLVYNSATARPRAVVAAAVTQSGAAAPPQTVIAELWLGTGGGESQVATATYPGWSSGTRQIVLTHEPSAPTQPAQLYTYTLKIKNTYPGASEQLATRTGRLLLVSRVHSRFGRGWALAGLEWVQHSGVGGGTWPNQPLLWVGGDGSARIYDYVGGSNPTYVATSGARPDTIRWVGDSGRYERYLKHGAQVHFDGNGRHVRTRSRTTQATTFIWAGSTDRLLSIGLPPAGTGGSYTLAYYPDSTRVHTITDPASRILRLVQTGTQLDSLADPDGRGVRFGYANSVLTSRKNRQGYTTQFSYTSAPAGFRVTSWSVPYGATGSQLSTTTYAPWDTVGLGIGGSPVAVDTAQALTRIFGPRAGIDDNATFAIDTLGAVARVTDALGATTRYERKHAAFPLLVTRVVYPTGRVVNMAYTARGNLSVLRDSTAGLTYGTLQIGTPNKKTTWLYTAADSAPDSPTQVSDSLGRTSTYSYNKLGLTKSAQDARGHKTAYAYQMSGALIGTLQQVTDSSVTTWRQSVADTVLLHLTTTLETDTRGNLTRVISPAGTATTTVNGATGQPDTVWNALHVKTALRYDGLGRDTLQGDFLAQYTPPGTAPTCDATQINCALALEPGYLLPDTLRLTRTWFGPAGVDSLADPRGVKRRYAYDARGQLTAEQNEFLQARTTLYDVTGRVASVTSRAGLTTTFQYDVLGRDSLVGMPARMWNDQWDPNQEAPADTVRHLYGALGLTTTHTNRNGTLQRWFNADGTLRKQTWRPLNGNWTDQVEYTYDATGARLTMQHNADLVSYAWDGAGDLQSLTVRFGADNINRVFGFTWDQLGRRKRIVYPITAGGQPMAVSFAYDALGTLRRQQAVHLGGGTNNLLNFTVTTDSTDRLGRTLRNTVTCSGSGPFSACAGGAGGTHRYSVQGWLVRQANDTMHYDLGGNLIWQQKNGGTVQQHTSQALSNRLHQTTSGGAAVTQHYFDSDGARYLEWSVTGNYPLYRYWYDAMGRVTGDYDKFQNTSNKYGADACRYDPLGQLTLPCQNLGYYLAFDGANAISAIRANGQAIQNPAWSYVHGPGIDDPLIGIYNNGNVSGGLAYSIYYYVTDGAGRQLAIATSNGTLTGTDEQNVQHQGGIYAGGASRASTFDASRFEGGGFKSGTSFFRNRLYDQSTGRWTQEDPIGVAGGINLYQFNGNDPSRYTDPFGLKQCDPPNTCTAIGVAVGGGIGATIGGVVALGCAATTGGVCSLGAPGIVSFFSAGGAALGGAIGSVLQATQGDAEEAGASSSATNPDGSEKEAGQQYEEITEAQRKSPEKIQSTKKSRQRDKQEIRQEAEDALRRLRGED